MSSMDRSRRKKVSLEELHLLPSEMVAEILSMLPVKYVLRCRSVCKAWRDIIDHHRFASMIFTRATLLDSKHYYSTFIFVPLDRNAHPLYLVEQQQHSTSFKATDIEFRCPMKTRHSKFLNANGLFGIAPSFAKDGHILTYIYNPTTRVSVKLPELPSQPKEGYIASGFGFDSYSEEYKMVHFCSPWSPLEIKAYVFTLGSNSWRRLEAVPNVTVIETAVSVNGSLHWVACGDYDFTLLTFDLRSEKFGVIPCPREIQGRFKLLNLGGRLLLYDASTHHNELWVMKDYNVEGSWTKLTIKNAPSCDFLQPISLDKNGDFLLLSDCRNFVSYNIESEKSTPLQIDGIPHTRYEVYPYVGNLRHLQQPAEEKSNHQQTNRSNKDRARKLTWGRGNLR